MVGPQTLEDDIISLQCLVKYTFTRDLYNAVVSNSPSDGHQREGLDAGTGQVVC